MLTQDYRLISCGRHSGVQYTKPPDKSTTAAADAFGNAAVSHSDRPSKATSSRTVVDRITKTCFFCEIDDPPTDECDTFKQLSLAEKVKLLVTNQAGMPGLAS
ncbi:hypothetical protein H9Q74_000010 [Fusarium xylarioides]|nr:hypothetical protein H9Q74_000010 [Fusarium xylarioides]